MTVAVVRSDQIVHDSTNKKNKMAYSFGLIVGVVDVAMNQNTVPNSPKNDTVQKDSENNQSETQSNSDSGLDSTLESIKEFVWLDDLGMFETVLKMIGEIPERWELPFARAIQLVKKHDFIKVQAEVVKYAESMEPYKALKILQVVVCSVIQQHKPEEAEKLPFDILEEALGTCNDVISIFEKAISEKPQQDKLKKEIRYLKDTIPLLELEIEEAENHSSTVKGEINRISTFVNELKVAANVSTTTVNGESSTLGRQDHFSTVCAKILTFVNEFGVAANVSTTTVNGESSTLGPQDHFSRVNAQINEIRTFVNELEVAANDSTTTVNGESSTLEKTLKEKGRNLMRSLSSFTSMHWETLGGIHKDISDSYMKMVRYDKEIATKESKLKPVELPEEMFADPDVLPFFKNTKEQLNTIKNKDLYKT